MTGAVLSRGTANRTGRKMLPPNLSSGLSAETSERLQMLVLQGSTESRPAGSWHSRSPSFAQLMFPHFRPCHFCSKPSIHLCLESTPFLVHFGWWARRVRNATTGTCKIWYRCMLAALIEVGNGSLFTPENVYGCCQGKHHPTSAKLARSTEHPSVEHHTRQQ